MEKKDIIILVATMAALAFSLYRRYMKKKNEGSSPSAEKKLTGPFSSSSKDDDYEPYSRK